MAIQSDEFQFIRETLLDISGMAIPENKVYLVENRLAQLLSSQGGGSYYDLFRRARQNPGSPLCEEIIDLMSTNETLWFRDQHPFLIFKERLLPTYLQEIKDGQRTKIRIWSAACSTGQEPYSLAMIIQDAMAENPFFTPEMVEIKASDISKTCLRSATSGLYDKVAIGRGLSDGYRNRYFTNTGKYWQVVDPVKNLVRFTRFNLQNDFGRLGKFDIIFCRNVAIYFSKQFKIELFAKFAAILKPGGVFILGGSESLSGYNSEFEIVQHGRGFFYRLER